MCALIGGPGAGQLTKMVNQIAIAGLVQGLAEALSFGKRAGSTSEVISVISKGAGAILADENRWKQMNDSVRRFRFAVDWMRKDLGICFDEAKRNGSRLPASALIDSSTRGCRRAAGAAGTP